MIKPYNQTENKKKQVTKMFDNIAKTYDSLNNLLSLKIHLLWRKSAIKKIKKNPKKILDIGTGTGDFAIVAAKYTNAKIIGIDLSKKMIDVGKKKVLEKNLNTRISFKIADAEKLPFKKNSFDVITSGFVVRNFENMQKGLSEIYRVLNQKGIILILEPSNPSKFPLKQIYNFYFSLVLPIIGQIISKDKNAYQYLAKSVKKFPDKNQFILELNKIGFKKCQHIPLSFGIASLYIAIK